MPKIVKRYETKLESVDLTDIRTVLDAKLEATSPESVTDYVALALDNLNAQIARMRDAKKELDYLIKMAQYQIDGIKVGTATWLTEAGVDSLQGDIVSSMKIKEPAPKETVQILNEESVVNQGYFKTVVDKTAVKEAINAGIYVDGAMLDVEHGGDTLIVYKRRSNASTPKKD